MALAQVVSWVLNMVILDLCESAEEKEFYLTLAMAESLTKTTLTEKILGKTYEKSQKVAKEEKVKKAVDLVKQIKRGSSVVNNSLSHGTMKGKNFNRNPQNGVSHEQQKQHEQMETSPQKMYDDDRQHPPDFNNHLRLLRQRFLPCHPRSNPDTQLGKSDAGGGFHDTISRESKRYSTGFLSRRKGGTHGIFDHIFNMASPVCW